MTRQKVLIEFFKWEGTPEATAKLMANRQAKSTIETYKGSWEAYVHWCRENDKNPVNTNVNNLAAYFMSMFDNTLAAQTIKCHRSSISGVISRITKYNYGTDPYLSDLMQALTNQSLKKKWFPTWSLELVLRALKKPPFEPIGSARIQFVLWKAAFLTSFAAALRVSELHALLRDPLEHPTDWSYVVLHMSPDFITKTEARTKAGSIYHEVRIPSIKSMIGPNLEDELLLCPVRALRSYILRTQPVRGNRKRLFMSVQTGRSTDVVVNTLSGWIRKCISHVYKNATAAEAATIGCKTHDLRKLSTSLGLMREVSQEDVLRAGSWSSPDRFISVYLTDLSVQSNGLYSLGPLVAARQVVNRRPPIVARPQF